MTPPFFFPLLPETKTIISGGLSSLGKDHRYLEGLCCLEQEGSFLQCSLSSPRWLEAPSSSLRLVLYTIFSHCLVQESQIRYPQGLRYSRHGNTAQQLGFHVHCGREWLRGGKQHEDGSGELTSKVTNWEFCEPLSVQVLSLKFLNGTGQIKQIVDQIQPVNYQCAASDAWALLFASASAVISSLKDLFQQLLLSTQDTRKSTGGWTLSSPALEGLLVSVGLSCGTEKLFQCCLLFSPQSAPSLYPHSHSSQASKKGMADSARRTPRRLLREDDM